MRLESPSSDFEHDTLRPASVSNSSPAVPQSRDTREQAPPEFEGYAIEPKQHGRPADTAQPVERPQPSERPADMRRGAARPEPRGQEQFDEVKENPVAPVSPVSPVLPEPFPPVPPANSGSAGMRETGTVRPENAGAVIPQDSGTVRAPDTGTVRPGDVARPKEAGGAKIVETARPAETPQPAASAPAESAPEKPVRLFGTVDFRGELKNLPKWERVRAQESSQPSFGPQEKERLTPAVAERWAKLRDSIKDKPLMEQVKAVNFFFNQWPYKTDAINYGIEDYWATPSEFVRKSGDCEDYAIAKYYALRNLGVPAKQLRVVALNDTIRNLGHAVLAVYMDGDAYILDNLTSQVLPHTKFPHYSPQYSVNEEYRWVHVKPVGK